MAFSLLCWRRAPSIDRFSALSLSPLLPLPGRLSMALFCQQVRLDVLTMAPSSEEQRHPQQLGALCALHLFFHSLLGSLFLSFWCLCSSPASTKTTAARWKENREQLLHLQWQAKLKAAYDDLALSYSSPLLPSKFSQRRSQQHQQCSARRAHHYRRHPPRYYRNHLSLLIANVVCFCCRC